MEWKEKIELMKAGGKVDIQTTNTELEILLDKYEWFHSSCVEGNSVCAYVNHMNSEVLNLIPDTLYGYQVKVAFSAYLECAEKYGKPSKTSDILNMLQEVD